MKIKSLTIVLLLAITALSACKKTECSFGDIKSPADLVLTTAVQGVTTALPNGNGTGAVAVNVKATNAITYKIDFGDGTIQLVPGGVITYKYTTPGTADYNITVNAVGTAGITSTVSKKIRVFVAFEIPQAIVTAMAGTGSKVWITDKAANGHFGVGAADAFFSN